MSVNNNKKSIYKWTLRDKFIYFIILVPFLIAFIGTAFLLATISIYLTIILISLYIITNIFQAGCCIGCPYRGKYCPALCGVFLGNYLLTKLYKNRQFNQKFFKINATIGESLLLINILFSVIFLFFLNFFYSIIVIVLIVMHFIFFFSLLCPKCSYNNTCPGGQTACKIFKNKSEEKNKKRE